MNILDYESFLNETKKTKKIDYNKKFDNKIEEINELISQAKKDDIRAIETESTAELEYVFDLVELTKTVCVNI